MNKVKYFNASLAFLINTYFFTVNSIAQNLVPNPSFEILSSCPEYLNGLPVLKAPPWVTPFYATNNGVFGTADIFSNCANPSAVGVPKNVKGFQFAHTGNGYAGFISYASGGSFPFSQREYLQVPLLAPLKAGGIYYIGFYVSLPDRYCAVSNVGMHLSVGTVPPVGDDIFSYEPQLESNQGWLSDTTKWLLIDGCFVAEGGEDYITIGNFRTNMESPLNFPCNDFASGYYYVDDVFVMDMSNLDLGADFDLCPGDTYTLFAGAGNTNYVWQDLSASDTFSVESPGVYYVEATNICGTVSDTIIVTLDSSVPQIFLPDTLTLCLGDIVTLDPQILGVDFIWSDGSHLPKLTINQPGEYFLTISNGCGSDIDNVIVLSGGAVPTVSLGSNIFICANEELEIQPISTDVDSWVWYNGSTSSSLSVSDTGVIYVTVFNDCGSASDTVSVLQSNGPPILDLGKDITACQGQSVLINSNVIGVSYLWQDGSTQSTITTVDSGDFILQVSNECGSSTDTINISFNGPPPIPFLGNDTTLCIGDVLTLHWTGPDDVLIQWDNGSSVPDYFIDISGQYSITALNLCGVRTDTIQVAFIYPPAPFSLGNDTVLCPGASILLSAPQNVGIITWQNGGHQSFFAADETSTYSVSVVNQCGVQSDEIHVEIDDRLASYPFDFIKPLCPNERIIIDVTQDFQASYLWSTGSFLPAIEVDAIGKYDVVVSTNCFIEKFDFEVISDTSCSFVPDLFVPNVFSPNGDNINDVLTISAASYVEFFEVEFLVYDRWGNLVFSATDLPLSWDGTFNDVPLNQGVFIYLLILTNKDTGIFKYITGDITLLK